MTDSAAHYGGDEHDAAAWCLILKSNSPISADEEARLQEWLEADERNPASLQQSLEAWDAMSVIADAPEVISFRADALDWIRLANQRRWQRPKGSSSLLLPIAVSFIGILIVGLFLFGQNGSERPATGVGERRAVQLADGSSVSLDARSRVSVSLSRGQRRLALEEGRAKFDVAHDAGRPFTVQIGKRIVVATGTSFSTELINGTLHVILYRGKVAVLSGNMPRPAELLSLRNHPGKSAVALKPGEEFVSSASGSDAGTVRPVSSSSLSWQQGMLDFHDEPLADAVAQLNRYSTDRIVIHDPPAGQIKISGVFEGGKSMEFLIAISSIYNLKITHEGSHLYAISM